MKKNGKKTGLEIAIVGMSGKFPKANSISELWEAIMNGDELIEFADKDQFEALGIDEETYTQENFVNAFGSFSEEEYFDAPFFKYQPAEASLMDPQIRVFHEVVWAALEDAGVIPEKEIVGLYAGANDNITWKGYNTFVKKNLMVSRYMASLLCDKDRLSTLISYKLNLKGPSIFIRSGCSTSLVGVHMGCRALLMGECNVAVAGGVTINSNKTLGYFKAENMIFSSDGHTKTFDASSDGTIFSNGAGAVVLKRLDKAIKDKDHIYAVINGSAINNDGNRKIGYTAPSIEGQFNCIQKALKSSRVDVNTIQYVEAHGTGTKLGDPIEIEALNNAFSNYQKDTCHIGSIKSNIGHLGAASGVAGLIKATLIAKSGDIPPTLHYTNPNPKIPFEEGSFKVADQNLQLPTASETPNRVAVSSFGIGGTNAHVILENYEQEEKQLIQNTPLIFPFSAKSKESLEAYLETFVDFLDEYGSELSLEDISYTLRHGRVSFAYREVFVAQSIEELKERIETSIRKIRNLKKTEKTEKKIVLMFPGQGVQYFEMGKELYETEAVFREDLNKGFEILQRLTSIDFKEILYQNSGQKDLMHDTKYTQPLLFIFQYALCKLLNFYGIELSHIIGHSFGEYTASCISGMISYEDAVKILIKRGSLMEKLPEGRMIGVSGSAEEIAPYLGESAWIASINSPNQCILSVEKEAVDTLMQKLEENQIKHRLLQISFASHCPMVDGVLDEYRSFLEQFSFQEGSIPPVSNLTGTFVEGREGKSAQYWCDHLRNTVDFSAGIRTLDRMENLVFLDVGPGDSLSRMFKQNKSSESKNTTLSLIRNGYDELTENEKQNHFKEVLGALWKQGAIENLSHIDNTETNQKISLPTYAFKRVKYPTYINLSKGFPEMDEHLEKLQQEEPELNVVSENFNSEYELVDQLIEVWKSFFGIESIDIDSDFFELGGDSMKAMMLIKLLNAKYGIKLTIKGFFKNPVLFDLADEIQDLIWAKKPKTFENKLTI